MADRSKIEKMLELLINEDQAAAEELFHEFVVQKSRDIYESMLEHEGVDHEDDEDMDEAYDDEDEDEDMDEAYDEDEDEETNEGFDMNQFEVEADDDIGGDPTDDMMADLGMDGDEEGDDMDMDMGGEEEEGDVEDRVVDLEDALEDLKAEFERMMSGEEGEDHDMDMDDEDGDDMDMDGDDMEMDDEDDDMDMGKESYNFESVDKEAKKKAADKKMSEKKAADKKMKEMADKKAADKKAADKKNEGRKSSGEQMREYVEKVTSGHGAEKKSSGDNGQNTKSAVAGPNNMGGSTASTVRSDVANDGMSGAGSTIKGSALSDTTAKVMSTGNINVPGGKAGKANKAVPKGHGAEKKGPGEKSDKSTTSTVNKLSSRAK